MSQQATPEGDTPDPQGPQAISTEKTGTHRDTSTLAPYEKILGQVPKYHISTPSTFYKGNSEIPPRTEPPSSRSNTRKKGKNTQQAARFDPITSRATRSSSVKNNKYKTDQSNFDMDVDQDAQNHENITSQSKSHAVADQNNKQNNDQPVDQPNVSSLDKGMIDVPENSTDTDKEETGQEEDEDIFYSITPTRHVVELVLNEHTQEELKKAREFFTKVEHNIICNPQIGADCLVDSKIQVLLDKTVTTENTNTNNVDNGESSDPTNDNKNKKVVGIRLIIILDNKDAHAELLSIPYVWKEADYKFQTVVRKIDQQREENKQTQSRVVQVFNSSIHMTSAILKPFMRRFGELEENGCYSRRSNYNSPNKQVFYVTFKEQESITRFFTQPRVWVYDELLYVTPLLLSSEKREEAKRYCAKLNGLPPNSSARDFQTFIKDFNVTEFNIPRNSRTDEPQKYAYVYFASEEDMQIGTQHPIVIKNKQTEWSPPDQTSCYRCGYTGHFIRDCTYRPPRNRPVNRRQYIQQTRYMRQNRYRQSRPTSYADAVKRQRSENNNERSENTRFNRNFNQRRNQRQDFERPWNNNNVDRSHRSFNDSSNTYKQKPRYDDYESEFMEEDIYDWEEPPVTGRLPNKPSVRHDLSKGTACGGSMHMSTNEKNTQQQTNNENILKKLQKQMEQLFTMVSDVSKDHSRIEEQLENLRRNPNSITSKSGVNKPDNKRVNFSDQANEHGKRSRKDDTSDSDNNLSNTVELLFSRLDNNGNNINGIFKALTEMQNDIKILTKNSSPNNKDLAVTPRGGNNANYEDSFIDDV